MEVIEVCEKRRPQPRPMTCPPYANKCTRRYVQPARVESYAPERIYCPPTKPLEANTTYHLSYLNSEQGRIARATPFRPEQNLDTTKGKFEDGTTNRLSYQPVWNVVKAKAIVPCRRSTLDVRGVMQCTTTARQDYAPKKAERPQVILPCGNIRTSSALLDAATTASLSYLNPGRVRPPTSYKPTAKYSPSGEPSAKETTQKLSYQPFRVARKETYPWATKDIYKPPVSSMDSHTTYSKSYMDTPNLPVKEKAIVPRAANILPSSEQFIGKTVYSESFLPCEMEAIVPVVPSDNIALSNDRMMCDTTNKLSYQAVKMEKRAPIRPSTKRTMGNGPMQSETTNRHDFVAKMVPRPDIIIPCDNISSSHDAPLEGNTTAALSYMNPGRVSPATSFKPEFRYNTPTSKIESDTINKLSYQSWGAIVKPALPWIRKNEYEPPKDRMATDTNYHMSFPAPGYYVDDCETVESPRTSRVATAINNNRGEPRPPRFNECSSEETRQQ